MEHSGKTNFLIAYDYGMGGLWGVIRARSAAEILAKYPEVAIVDVRPQWMNDDKFNQLSTPARLMDIDGDPDGSLLMAVVTDRKR